MREWLTFGVQVNFYGFNGGSLLGSRVGARDRDQQQKSAEQVCEQSTLLHRVDLVARYGLRASYLTRSGWPRERIVC